MPTTAPGWPCVSTIAPPPTSNRLVSSTQQQHMTPLPAVAVTTSAAGECCSTHIHVLVHMISLTAVCT